MKISFPSRQLRTCLGITEPILVIDHVTCGVQGKELYMVGSEKTWREGGVFTPTLRRIVNL